MPIVDLRAHVERESQQLRKKCRTDPAAAITDARTLLESTCKHILESRGHPCPSKLPQLTKNTLNALRDWVTEGTPRQVLESVGDNVCCLVVAVGALRDSTSNAHGEDRSEPRSPTKNDARLVVGLACSVASYLTSLWSLTFVVKRANELTPSEKADLVSIVTRFVEAGKIDTRYDNLAYTRRLEEVRADFLQKTGIRPSSADTYRAILNLRKAGKLPSNRSAKETGTEKSDDGNAV